MRLPVCEDIWTSPHLHVSAIIYDTSRPLIITFTPAAPTREAFGGTLFQQHRINHIAVTCMSPDWWQIGAVDEAGAALHNFASKFPRVVHYGSSMGGYGALFFSGAVQPDCVVAIAPQFSIEPGEAPLEKRWAANVPRIIDRGGFVRPAMAGRIMQSGKVFILFDPANPDARHIPLFEAVRPIERIVSPFGGHGLIVALKQMGLDYAVGTMAIDADPDPAVMRREIRSRRRDSAEYFYNMIAYLQRSGKSVQKVLALAINVIPQQQPGIALAFMNAALQAGEPNLMCRAFLAFINGAIVDGDVGLIARMRDRAPLLIEHDFVSEAADLLDGWIGNEDIPDITEIAKVNNTLRRYAPADPLKSYRVRSAVRLLEWSGALDTVSLAKIAKAILLRAAGDANAGTALLREVSVLLGGWHPFNLEVAKTWAAFGDDTKAVMFARRVAEREAVPGAAAQFLAVRLENVGDYDGALRWFERLTDAIAPTSPAWSASLVGSARCLRRMGSLADALALLDQALEKAPQNVLAARMRESVAREMELGRNHDGDEGGPGEPPTK
ncbi:tetratricopeptide repeat protein [Sphingobium cupriresistens]|uniref:Tetratricopeptide repeat protein n=1 Tax=Sphingobium cupriresistens TaxID=1132417 RepID=A0A8G2DWH1_9SPHN|nr:tetratricopeptide repeat protein [Sphingobium cupriresistens]RYM07978.1 tetratricopeptide repeat protein [Sphingobium cupriresistens]